MVLSLVKCVLKLGTSLYYPADKGSNCPIDKVLKTEAECMEASAQLGFNYRWQLTDNRDPAGCYWSRTDSFLNTFVDPSTTAPEAFQNRGGLCLRGKLAHVSLPRTTLKYNYKDSNYNTSTFC